MKKVFVVNFKNIEYLGDTIGDDIFSEIKVADQFLKIDKKIKRGDKAAINKEVAYFETEKNLLELPINIKMTEDDALFDDVGVAQGTMRVDLDTPLPQNKIFEIRVREKRGASGKRAAIFRVVLEADYAVRYVEDVDRQGWLRVKPDNGGEEFSIPIHLKVQLGGKDDGREHFAILEGIRKNTKASVKLKKDSPSRFSKNNPHKKSAILIYSISKKTLKFGKKTYKTTDYPEAPWTKGIYNIEIPDNPHKLGLAFIGLAPHAITWFRISHPDGDRYLHTGGRSRGCITLIEQKRWDELYWILISTRRGDNLNIGTITVVD